MGCKNSLTKWNNIQNEHREKWSRNPFIKLFFDPGHRYIANRGKNVTGKILDVGGGIGYHSKFEVINQDREYICLDCDQSQLNKITNCEIKKLCADCENIPLPDKSIDLVIASHILEHLLNLDNCLIEFNRILKNDGALIVVLPCDPGLLWNALTKFTPSRLMLWLRGINYDEVMRAEHINSFESCQKALARRFEVVEAYYPYKIANSNFNVICGMMLRKKL